LKLGQELRRVDFLKIKANVIFLAKGTDSRPPKLFREKVVQIGGLD